MILEHTVVGPLAVNCFIIGCKKTKQAVVIDPGDELSKILNILKNNDLTLKYILITHCHIDHVTLVEKMQNSIDCQVFMHKEDLFLIDNLLSHAQMFGLPDPGKPHIDHFVEDNEIIKVGQLEIKVLHTPGHSPGSVSYKINNNVIVGDLIFSASIGRTDLPGGNYDTLINSVNTKIFTLADDTKIYPGHGPFTTVRSEKASNPFFN